MSVSITPTMTISSNLLQRKEPNLKLKHVGLDDIPSGSTSRSSYRGSASRARTRSIEPDRLSIESVILTSPVLDPHEKILELKRKLSFVKSEHQLLLKSLHAEIEDLKKKNKDLQLQLVMKDFSAKIQTDSSKESDSRVPTVQVLQTQTDSPELETIENNIKRLESDLHEARSRNIYLTELVENQKKKLQEYDLRQAASVLFKQSGIIQQQQLQQQQRQHQQPLRIDSASSTIVSTPRASRATIKGEAGDDEEDDNSVDLPVTPGSDAPVEYSAKLQEAEFLIDKLRQENQRQKEELIEIRQSFDRGSRMKFRGCNHPNSRSRKTSVSPTKPRDLSMDDSLRSRKSFSEHQFTGSHLSRAESEDYFPPLAQSLVSSKSKRSRSQMLSELPPVPGSSGSDSSTIASRRLPLNLVSLGDSNGHYHNHLPSVERKTNSKKLPGLFEQYRFSRSNDYMVGQGPLRAFQPFGSTQENLDNSLSQQKSNRKISAKLKSALSMDKLNHKK